MTFLIEVIKALIIFIAICVGASVLYIALVIVREVGWMIQEENRKQYKEYEAKQKESNNK